MLQHPIFDVAIGMIFLFLLVSLLATAIQEAWAGKSNLRGKLLYAALRNMIGPEKTQKIFNHPIIAGTVLGDERKLPSYLDKENFAKAFINSLKGYTGLPEELNTMEEKIRTIPDARLREVLLSFKTTKEEELVTQLANWFDTGMDRVSGYYKRIVQNRLLVTGLALAVILNADAIYIFKHLSTDEKARMSVVQSAIQFSEQNNDTTLNIAAHQILEEELSQQNDELKSTMGMGWNWRVIQLETNGYNFLQWLWWALLKLVGWTITGYAVTVGAPFWFDLLKKIIQIRNTGTKPEEKKE